MRNKIDELFAAVEAGCVTLSSPDYHYLSMLPTVRSILGLVEYGDKGPASVNRATSYLSDVVLCLARMCLGIEDRKSFLEPRHTPRNNCDAMDWASSSLLYPEHYHVREFVIEMVGLVNDTAKIYGRTYEQILEIAIKKAA